MKTKKMKTWKKMFLMNVMMGEDEDKKIFLMNAEAEECVECNLED